MNSPDIASAVLAEHHRDLRRQARASALAALVRCRRPSTWSRAVRRVAGSFPGSDRSAHCT